MKSLYYKYYNDKNLLLLSDYLYHYRKGNISTISCIYDYLIFVNRRHSLLPGNWLVIKSSLFAPYAPHGGPPMKPSQSGMVLGPILQISPNMKSV